MRVLLFSLLIICISCSKEKGRTGSFVSGVVTNEQGQPLAGAKIIVDHSIFFNSSLNTTSDGAGKYSLAVPDGSWYAFATYEKGYRNKNYRLYLDPDNAAGFGGEGAVRNFRWKLTGEKAHPLSGYYGGLVTIDSYAGSYVDATNITFTFTPQDKLIDGSEGQPLVLKAPDGNQLQDLPMGRYAVVAEYRDKPLLLRKWNSNDAFEQVLEFDFEPQIDGQCDNCFKIEYKASGTVTGMVTDERGQVLPGVKVIVDHNIFFNSNLSTTSDGAGKYSLDIPGGSWYAFAIYEKVYRNKNYRLHLHPDNAEGFGGEGAVRDFKWKLTGEKPYPLSGYYGGLVTIDGYPGNDIKATDIAFTFIPQEKLIDGSDGQSFVAKAADGHELQDLPIGKYAVVAEYKGDPILLRKWNSHDAFEPVLVFDFEPQIDGQCDNCFKIEYNKQ